MQEIYTMNWEEYERINGRMNRINMTMDEMTAELKNFVKETEMKNEQMLGFTMNMGLTNDEERLLALGDDMASAMTNLNPQNYKEFVDSRDRFRKVISEIVTKQRKSEERIAKMKADILAA